MPSGGVNYLLLLCCALWLVINGRESCSSDDFFKLLGTATPYRVVANYNATPVSYPGCEATKIWSLVRHGTRNPSARLIERMRDRLPAVRDLILENLPQATDKIHNFDLESFRKWSTKLQEKDEKKLALEGQDEMVLLAERMQQRFPNILREIYSETSYQFKFTATQRTRKSAQFFATGLFGRDTVQDIEFPEPLKKDPILRFYKLCNKWKKDVKHNPEAIKERRKFEQSPVMIKTIREVNQRLGLKDELNLSDVHTMYMTCAFETAWNKRRKSPWCAPFTLDDFRVMEYAEDLKYFWVDGYGHELTYKQACPAFNDMIDFFQNEEEFPKSVFYFTHSGTLLKMLAHLGLYHEEQALVSVDYNKRRNRQWRVSNIDAFGTNLAFVLFRCGEQQQVLTLHQERVVRLPSCPDSDLCGINEVLDYYSNSVECGFDEMCDN